jgi:hypothetical protein
MTVEGYGVSGERLIVNIEPVTIAPGRYELSVVAEEPGAGEPRTAVVEVELPPIPRRGLVVAEPALIRQVREGVTVYWGEGLSLVSDLDDENEFEPVLPDEPVQPGPLAAVTHVCWIDPVKDEVELRVERSVSDRGGDSLFALEPIGLHLAVDGADPCRAVRDELPADSLGPGTYDYQVSVRLDGEQEPILRRATFTIGPSEPPRESNDE